MPPSSLPAVELTQRSEQQRLFARLVRGPVAAQVRLVEVLDSTGSPQLTVRCDTRVACFHAMTSLAAHSRTPLADWSTGWSAAADGGYALGIEPLREEPYDDLPVKANRAPGSRM